MSGWGLTDARRGLDSQARMGLQQAAQREQQIDLANDQLAQQDKANKVSSVTTGAGLGMGLAMAAGGPVGWAMLGGSAAGLLAYELF